MAAADQFGYPVHVLWGVVVLTIALRHNNFEACLGELGRNPSLAKLIDIESPEQIPCGWNVSRFLETLGQEPHLAELQSVFNVMASRLGRAVGDLGKDTAGDATALNARLSRRDAAKRKKEQEASQTEKDDASAKAQEEASKKIEYDDHGLPQPSGGRKEYKDDEGRVTRVVEWFRYKLHLLVDVKHEVSLSPTCNAGKTYGLTIRVKQDIDLRRFPSIPRVTKQFERLYKGRTSVERVNARFKIFWGLPACEARNASRKLTPR